MSQVTICFVSVGAKTTDPLESEFVNFGLSYIQCSLFVVELSIKYLKQPFSSILTYPILSCPLIGHCPKVHIYISGIFVICGNESCHS